ncbi:DsbA family oxidoreductase [Hyphococcus sp.]|uniref:DsbA family oxidoreductase n=1 Tax=Hyphococcus sp. TaxID=2038636 RepID=UPI0035C71840
MTAQDRARLLVDLVADPVCPWCYVGLKAFMAAKERLKNEFIVLPRIRAYQLNPDTPAEGVDRQAYYEKKFPDEGQRAQMIHQLKAAALGAGFAFDPSKPAHLPNTLKAHQIIRLAHFDGAQERLALALYAAYWDESADIGDDESLVALAAAAGLDAENARQDLKNPKSIAEIKSEAEAFRQAGVTGVPTFIVNERTGFAGALPPARLAETLREAAAATRVQ